MVPVLFDMAFTKMGDRPLCQQAKQEFRILYRLYCKTPSKNLGTACHQYLGGIQYKLRKQNVVMHQHYLAISWACIYVFDKLGNVGLLGLHCFSSGICVIA